MQYLFPLFFLMGCIFANAEPLPAKEVFKPHIQQQTVNGEYQTSVSIDFPRGYYLYADKTTLTGGEGRQQRSPALSKQDPYLGKTEIWETPPTITLTHHDPITQLTLKTQGCEADVICYPPTTWTLKVPESPKTAKNPPPANTDGVNHTWLNTGGKNLFKKNSPLLSEEQAFQITTAPEENGKLRINYRISPGYYLYRNSLKAKLDGKPVPAFPLPQGEVHEDEFLGKQEIYRHDLQITLPLPPLPEQPEHTLTLYLQGCAQNRICYPPLQRQFTLPGNLFQPTGKTAVSGESQSRQNLSGTVTVKKEHRLFSIARLKQHFFLTLPLLLLLGIGVSFTACIYPLIPIVTSLVVGKNTSTARAYGLITAYVLSMGAAMALLGAVFAVFEINLQVILQKPWITVLVALLFAGLSLSLFDFYTLTAPRFLQRPIDRLMRRQASGSYPGAIIMGGLSVLVVSPCATPVLTALLLFSTQTTPTKGAVALFMFGLGTGLPLFLFAGAFRQFMPKAGKWMDGVKKCFAFALLAIALWLLTRIMPTDYALICWALYALFIAVFLYRPDAGKGRLYLAGVAFIIAVSLSVQGTGMQFSQASRTALPTADNPTTITFRRLETLEQIESAIAASAQPVWLDFYADWCVACKKWEQNIWHNPRFARALSHDTLLKIDVTDFNKNHRQIFQRLGIVGPPAVFYYPAGGNINAPTEKIIGEITAEEFAVLLKDGAQNKL